MGWLNVTLANGVLAEDTDKLMGQIRDQLEEVKTHGFGRIEVIVRHGNVTTIHAQKTWVRKGANTDH